MRIRSRRELTLYVVRTTCLCAVGALACDIVNQFVFFAGWPATFRSWAVTVAITVAITGPVSRAIGRTHLTLFDASRTDELTGLLNRRALLDCVDDLPSVIALIIVDIDRFKQVNDTHGHLAGDEVLRTVARRMGRLLGPLGRVGRIGGEEFAVVVAAGLADRLAVELEAFRQQIASTPVIVGTNAVSVTISAGFATRAADQSFEHLYALADRALYLAKAAGRNQIVSADALPPHLGRDTTFADQRRPHQRLASS